MVLVDDMVVRNQFKALGRGGMLRPPEARATVGWEDWLGFEPDVQQGELLRGEVRRLVLNCTRQWGKSTITAAKAVLRAQERAGSLVLVVSPSARQSGEFLRKAAGFLHRMGMPARGDGDNEISLLFPNGSRMRH